CPLLPAPGELTPTLIARVLVRRLARMWGEDALREPRSALERLERGSVRTGIPQRRPYFCAGCPHNSSTRVPEGSRAFAGIGCHYMVQWMERDTEMFTQMGAEGANWIGLAPFTATPHVFQNIGDGTYVHSGLLAIRAAVAAKVNITYKILYNDAVAMTGGQPMEGPLDVPMITRQISGEGVKRVAVVSDQPEKYPLNADFAKGVTIHHRHELDAVQRELREVPGVSVLVYDQMCATEKRRRRKRGLLEDPARFVFINERVCEGCGDCSRASNCLAVVPVETAYGRKRAIDYAQCNKDESCVDGFCPSFVIVEGARLRRPEASALARPSRPLPEPARFAGGAPWNAVIAGVGGTGVVTTGQILAVAAHLAGRAVTALDHTGLAQKYGAVFGHVRIADAERPIFAPRIPDGAADLLLGCDLLVAGSGDVLVKASPARTTAIVSTEAASPGEFTRDPDLRLPGDELRAAIGGATRATFVPATRYASALTGDSLGANLLLVGFAYQRGLVPVAADALEAAIRLNGVAVERNLAAFRWGRLAAHDPAFVEERARRGGAGAAPHRLGLEALVEIRAQDLAEYQNARLAERYRALVGRVREAERRRAPGRTGLAEAVARNYHKLLAYKDEYEVARLYSGVEFRHALKARFEGRLRLRLSLAPPLFATRDPSTGRPRKRLYGPWIFPALRLLARLRGLRGTPFDPFGYTKERRRERELIADYEGSIGAILDGLSDANHAQALELAELPEQIRGFGPIKEAAIACAKEREAGLRARFQEIPLTASAAE
ncbi:MAG TPA: indolepyruvate ferredoxin oxidoreductase family protein, partial [Alphaproteobacteria bacterium]|nr:indolepyruvate ferredoxin oxidoreductase family protein [Alphaproteobacteria bacterium]